MRLTSSTAWLIPVAMAALAPVVCPARPLAPLTYHVRAVTLNGQAKSVGRLPATQSLRIVFVLPQRNQAALNKLLKDSTILPVLRTASSSRWENSLQVWPSQQD